jgi:hypothetical protein
VSTRVAVVRFIAGPNEIRNDSPTLEEDSSSACKFTMRVCWRDVRIPPRDAACKRVMVGSRCGVKRVSNALDIVFRTNAGDGGQHIQNISIVLC